MGPPSGLLKTKINKFVNKYSYTQGLFKVLKFLLSKFYFFFLNYVLNMMNVIKVYAYPHIHVTYLKHTYLLSYQHTRCNTQMYGK
jgi:hypothetical protein